MPAVIYNTFKELNLGDFTICINNRKLLNGLFESLELKEQSTQILRVIDKIEKIGAGRVRQELLELTDESKVNTIMTFLNIEGTNDAKLEALENIQLENEIFKEGIEELKEVVKFIRIFGVPEENFKIDLTIARGLDYYTGTVYEVFFNQYKELGSVCSGGRYDNLTEYYSDRKMPGVGMAIGLTRLFYLLTEYNIVSAENESISEALVVSMTEDYDVCAKIAEKLREAGIRTQLNIEQQKIGKKFKYADKLNIKNVIIIGEDEIKNNVVTLKNMDTGDQNTITLEEAIKIISKEEVK